MSRQNSARADGKKVVSFCVLFSLYINFINIENYIVVNVVWTYPHIQNSGQQVVVV